MMAGEHEVRPNAMARAELCRRSDRFSESMHP